MFRPLRPIRPVRAVRPVGAPLVRGLVIGGDRAAKLTELARMAQQGLLTPEEFATAKARLLTG